MNGGRWGEVIRVHVHSDGTIWVFHRCFNTVPPGIATCLGRGDANPPILQFDPSGKLLKSLGGGMFVNPHGFTVDHEGNLWVSDVNDKETVLGMSARNASGVVLGQEVLKLDQNGKFITAWHQFGQPSSVFVGPDDKIYVGVALRDEATRRNASSQVQPGELRGIVVGSAIDGSLLAFIPDPSDLNTVGAGTSASGIAADAMGNVYAADVGAHKV